ncbi:MAG: tetratricopeptide repeat protein [Gammaproteobacteria bacterium]|nr:tetratricopeptide repeat protein [Gammaproteobacteria bacterium]
MSSLFAELKRRNVFRVGVAYVVAAWVIAQVADLVLENIGAPSWVMQSLLLLMTLGFVAALIIAWAYEITPEGIKRESEVVRSESITHETSKRLNIITIGLLLFAIGFMMVDRFWLENTPPEPVQPRSASVDIDGVGSRNQSTQGLNVADEKSIAVLPFVNMSSDKEQEYFADGISEEILNALVKATGLRVSGRTSSFSFKGKDANIQEIGRILNVAHVLEGSVRKQGNQVRITAQLIKADDGFHLWSETYDRSLENIFDVQDDISRQVTSELRILLKLDDQSRLANALTANMDAYDLFLRGRDYIGKRIDDNLPIGISLLEEAVELDPEFAEAWAALAEAEAVLPNYTGTDHLEGDKRALQHARIASELNPALALPHAVVGLVNLGQGRVLEALRALDKAHEMEPNNVSVLRWRGTISQSLGHFEDAAAYYDRALTLDPMSRTDSFNKAVNALVLGDLDEAERHFVRTAELQGATAGEFVGDIRFLRGDRQGAIDFFTDLNDEMTARYGADTYWSRADAEIFARGMYSGREADRQAALRLEHVVLTAGDDIQYWQVYEHIKIGNFRRAFEILEAKPEYVRDSMVDFFWFPLPRSVEFRKQPEFRALLERHGVVDAWQHLGWPDLCQPDPGTDGSDGQFSCN